MPVQDGGVRAQVPSDGMALQGVSPRWALASGSGLLPHQQEPEPGNGYAGGAMSVWAGRFATPTGQVSPLGPWLQ